MSEYSSDEMDLAFARKYRPVGFDGYIGNESIKETVFNMMKRKRFQTMLFSGNSGCGKTTISRIIAREYRCENRDPETGACGVCPSCMEFEEYIKTGKMDSLNDVYEVDASQSSGKDAVDSVLSSMEYPAISGDWKTYIFDEAHLLTGQGMGRLLKSIEEPPEGVLIILCTTDPDKLLDTVRNRCQLKYQVAKPSTLDIMKLLKGVCENEGKEYDLEGLRMIAAKADNVVRDSLNYLETVIMARESATGINVSLQYKQVDDKIVLDFLKAYQEDNYIDYIDIMYKVKTQFDFKQFVNSLTIMVTRGIYTLNSVPVDGITAEELQSYQELFGKFTPEDLARILRELKRMSYGSIEANLMAFIYCKHDIVAEGNKKAVIEKETPVSEEVVYRNNNLQRLEQAKVNNGRESLKSEMVDITMNDIMSMFNIEKVSG